MLHLSPMLVRNDSDLQDTFTKIMLLSNYWKGELGVYIEDAHVCIFVRSDSYSFMIYGRRLAGTAGIPVQVALGSPREADLEHPLCAFDFHPVFENGSFDVGKFQSSITFMTDTILTQPPNESRNGSTGYDYAMLRQKM